MIRHHDVKQLTTVELERARRELQANIGLITPGSPAHVPIQAHMRAIDTELTERAGNQQAARTGVRLGVWSPVTCWFGAGGPGVTLPVLRT